MPCAGVNLSGYWKGHSCGAIAKFKHEGKDYCSPHFAVAVNDPQRFEKVKAQFEKRHGKKWSRNGIL